MKMGLANSAVPQELKKKVHAEEVSETVEHDDVEEKETGKSTGIFL
jgi:hypothetical protein